MKRFAYLACGLAALLAMGCENGLSFDKKSSSVQLSEEEKNIISNFSVIGEQHNEVQSDYYELHSGRVAIYSASSGDEKFNEYFAIDADTVFITVDTASSSPRSTDTSCSLVEELSSQGLIDSNAEYYIARVEKILEESFDSLESTQSAILQIEKEAISELSDDSLAQFMSYAETAESSLCFWHDNYETLTGESSSARFISSLWKKYKKKVAMSAASDAAGAAIGAVVAGAASSVEGFKTGKLCVVVPVSKIKSKM